MEGVDSDGQGAAADCGTSGGDSVPPSVHGHVMSTGAVHVRALWIVANLVIGSLVWFAAAFFSILAFRPDPKDPAPSVYDTVVLGLIFTVVMVAVALIPFVIVNALFRLFDKSLKPRAYWWSSAALGAGAAAVDLGSHFLL